MGAGAAWLVTMYRFRGSRVLDYALLFPLAIPAYVGAYALVDFLDYAGPLQTALRIRIQASDVSLVLQPPLQSSIRNILRAKVAQCFDDNGQVEVQLEIGSKTLWARISPWARDELGIKPGLWLYAQIKSVSITA